MTTKIVATYYYDCHQNTSDSVFEVIAYYESVGYKNNPTIFYRVFDKIGKCLNENSPLYSIPTWEFIDKNYRNNTKDCNDL